MLVIDLFSGLGGFSEAFKRRGHTVIRVDWNRSYAPDICTNIRSLTPGALPTGADWIVASPPCERFSVASVGHHWNGSMSPLTADAIANVEHTVSLIEALRPKWYLIENPMGMLRKLDLIPYERFYTTLCRYGAGRMKPTDFWGRVPRRFKFRDPCAAGDWCHTSTPRGTHGGVQTATMSPAERAMMPYAFSLSLLRASDLDRAETGI